MGFLDDPKVTKKEEETKEWVDVLGDQQKKTKATTTVEQKQSKTGKV